MKFETATLSIFVLAFSFSGCCPLLEKIAGKPSSTILGAWKFKNDAHGPQILTFRKDNTYRVDFYGDGTEDIIGRYGLLRGRIRMDGENPRINTECYTPGFFKYTILRDELGFVLLADQCNPRKRALSAARIRVP